MSGDEGNECGGGGLNFTKIDYNNLNARQQENYNFQKAAARLADYGFNCIKLSDDWQGADFLAIHVEGKTILKVQLKGRLMFDEKYYEKDLFVAFFQGNEFYLYPHDKLRAKLVKDGIVEKSKCRAWREEGSRSWSYIPKILIPYLENYKL